MPKRRKLVEEEMEADGKTIHPTSSATSSSSSSSSSSAMPSTIKLNVGGAIFLTTRSTLTLHSMYFEAMLNGPFSESSASEMFIDRDPESFATLLTYFRTGRLLVSATAANSLLFSRVLVEADFYGVESLIATVKLQCTRNLKHFEYIKDMTAQAEKFFPTLNELLNHPLFPDIYFAPTPYVKIIHVFDAPDDVYVKLLPVDEIDNPPQTHRVLQMITFENIIDHKIVTEPYIHVQSDEIKKLIPWQFLRELPNRLFGTWPNQTNHIQMPTSMPVSYFVRALQIIARDDLAGDIYSENDAFQDDWIIQTQTIIEYPPDDGPAFTCLNEEGENFLAEAQYGNMIRNCTNPGDIEITLYGKSKRTDVLELKDVRKYTNFVSFDEVLE